MGGFEQQDRKVIKRVRQHVADYRIAYPGDERAVATELTLSEWLDDEPRVSQLFAALVEIEPDIPGYRLAWAKRERVRRHYGRAASILDSLSESVNRSYEYSVLHAHSLLADNHVDEACAVLAALGPASPAGDSHTTKLATALQDACPRLMQQWESEQSHRAAHRLSSPAPQAEVITSRGRLVIQLLPDVAPMTVSRFLDAVTDKAYVGASMERMDDQIVVHASPVTDDAQDTSAPRWPTTSDERSASSCFAGSVLASAGPTKSDVPTFAIADVPALEATEQQIAFGYVIEGLDVSRSLDDGDTLLAVRIVELPNVGHADEGRPLAKEAQDAQ